METHFEAEGFGSVYRRIEHKIAVVSNGLTLPNDVPCVATRPYDVAYVGRLKRSKGVEILRNFVEKDRGLRVLVAGADPSGRNASWMRERAKASSWLEYAGSVPPEKMSSILNQSKVLILPSLGEGLPNSALEAIAHGLPVVATPVGCVPEVVRDGATGRLVPVGDLAALEQSVKAIVNDPSLLETMSQSARSDAARYSWTEVVPRLEILLQEIAG